MAVDAAIWGLCQQSLANLLRYAERDRFADARNAVGAAHLAAVYAVAGEGDDLDRLMELVEEDTIATITEDAVIDFAVRADSRGRTLIDRYLDERGMRETPAGRDFLRGLKESRVGVFEVLPDPEQGAVGLRDVLREGASLQVAGDPDLAPLGEGELIGARILPLRGDLCFVGGVWILDPDSVEALRAAWAGEDVAALAADPDFTGMTAEELRESARENLAAMISNLVIEQEIGDLTVDHEDGEPYEPTRVSWDVSDEREVAARLDALAECARWADDVGGDEPVWSWLDLEAADGLDDDEEIEADNLLGTIRLGGGTLELFVDSQLRAVDGRTLLEQALAGLVRNGRSEPFTLAQALDGGGPTTS